MQTVLRGIDNDRNRHAWHIALAGLRRGENRGQRWADIDLANKDAPQRRHPGVDVGGRALDQDEPKTAHAGQVLPIPDALLAELTAARNRQAAEKLALGEAYSDQGCPTFTPNPRRSPRRRRALLRHWRILATEVLRTRLR